jgi:hypothetical protein
METVLNTLVTLSVTINCAYDNAFNYLSIPLNQKEWAILFFKILRKSMINILQLYHLGNYQWKSNFKNYLKQFFLNEY